MAIETSQIRFGEGFLDDHAGRIISNPQIALVELVANSWDAGSRRVDIKWPKKEEEYFEIVDDGTGMVKDEFERIWAELNYNRVKMQGHSVKFPGPSTTIKRSAYGRNGKGRHSLFCFSNEYNVETWKDDISSSFHIKRSWGESPYEITFVKQGAKKGHGTKIWCNILNNYIGESEVQELLGSKFITDPAFVIYINDHKIDLLDLQDGVEQEEYDIPGEEENVRILRIDSQKTGRVKQRTPLQAAGHVRAGHQLFEL